MTAWLLAHPLLAILLFLVGFAATSVWLAARDAARTTLVPFETMMDDDDEGGL